MNMSRTIPGHLAHPRSHDHSHNSSIQPSSTTPPPFPHPSSTMCSVCMPTMPNCSICDTPCVQSVLWSRSTQSTHGNISTCSPLTQKLYHCTCLTMPVRGGHCGVTCPSRKHVDPDSECSLTMALVFVQAQVDQPGFKISTKN